MPRRHENARERDKVWSEEYVKRLNQLYATKAYPEKKKKTQAR